jgi:hypothetical protein
MMNHVSERGSRSVMKIRSARRHSAQRRHFELPDVFALPGDQRPARVIGFDRLSSKRARRAGLQVHFNVKTGSPVVLRTMSSLSVPISIVPSTDRLPKFLVL